MICAIVLAAGHSERMGTQKLLLPLDDKPVIAHVLDELLSSLVEQVLVVTGRDNERISEVLGNRPVKFVENLATDSDMLGSVRCGLRALPESCEGVMVVLGDQPGLKHELVNAMIHHFRDGKQRIVVPMHKNHRGHPVLFSTQFCDEVLRSHPVEGLRGFLEAHPEEVFPLPVASADGLEDMDTPADYQRQARWFANRVRP